MNPDRCPELACGLPTMGLYAEGPPSPDGTIPVHRLQGIRWCPRHGPIEMFVREGSTIHRSLPRASDRPAPRGSRVWRGTFEDEIPEVAIIGETRGLRRVRGCRWDHRSRRLESLVEFDPAPPLTPSGIERLTRFAVTFELEAELSA